MKKVAVWRVFRVGVVVFSGSSAAFSPVQPYVQVDISWFGVVLSGILIPLLFLFATLLMTVFRGNKLDVQTLGWAHNPFDFSHPEHFWHLGAFVMLVSGVVLLARSFFQHGQVFPGTAMPVAFSLGLLALLHVLAAVSGRTVRE